MFEDFFAAVKRFGFSGDLNDEHLAKIAPEINLDYNQLSIDTSAFFVFYMDEDFRCKENKRHSVKALLEVGWLVCQHRTEDE
jgi:hypothetical protein